MSNFYLFKGNKIAITMGGCRSNGLFAPTNIENLITAHGLLIPVSSSFMNVLDMLEDTTPAPARAVDSWCCSILDYEGVLRDFYVDSSDGESTIKYERQMTGPGCTGARSRWLEVEERAMASLALCETVEEALDLIVQHNGYKREWYKIFEIPELLKMMGASKGESRT
ncbi:hypothetical protein pEaSNUABM54_00208 [Erwinia phage pEa_SNUABM_54]|nr:hypothetical protein pEaSNUABM54_00208 [Erwinia phage pEa_SNUABM_54]